MLSLLCKCVKLCLCINVNAGFMFWVFKHLSLPAKNGERMLHNTHVRFCIFPCRYTAFFLMKVEPRNAIGGCYKASPTRGAASEE